MTLSDLVSARLAEPDISWAPGTLDAIATNATLRCVVMGAPSASEAAV